MFFSFSTIAIVAGMLASPLAVSGSPLEERSNNLCNQAHYGASGYPWQSSATPGSYCGSSKPSNSGGWRNIPYWDGGDHVKCSGRSGRNLDVCNGGNKGARLPKNCRPPHRHHGQTSTSTTPASTSTSVIVTSSSAAVSSSSAAGSSSAVSSSSAAASPTVVSSAAASPSASSASTSVVDPTADPVCELTYQETFDNYTLVAPNGVWTGMTVGAAVQDASYMTYTLSDTIDNCLQACSQIEGCVFVNTYYDVNASEADLPKHTPGVLTCAMYSTCVGTDEASNWGGQDDPNTIVNSNGYCLATVCGAASS
ncbi:hypothetical protein P7C73_g3571, partial [Tremellales sp. Uapishka_1]